MKQRQCNNFSRLVLDDCSFVLPSHLPLHMIKEFSQYNNRTIPLNTVNYSLTLKKNTIEGITQKG